MKELVEEQEEQGLDYSVPSLKRGMAILELLARHHEGLGLVEIADGIGVTYNSVFRTAQSLVQLGYLKRNKATRKFTLSRKLLGLGLSTVHECNIVERAYDTLRSLRNQLKEATALGALVPEKGHGLILASLDHLHVFGYVLRIGMEFELHCSAPGKALLAPLPEPELKEVLKRMTFTRQTPHSITAESVLRKELERVRYTGYATDVEEYAMGGVCVAAPVCDVFGSAVATIWTMGPSDRMPSERLAAIGAQVKTAAERISKELSEPMG
jgi:DNA-binding IclR family transcriptional regulator